MRDPAWVSKLRLTAATVAATLPCGDVMAMIHKKWVLVLNSNLFNGMKDRLTVIINVNLHDKNAKTKFTRLK